MKTYEDFKEVVEKESEDDLKGFLLSAIEEHKSSECYKTAKTAQEYFEKRNTTITEYRKLLYTITGEAVQDNYSANYKLTSGFFETFITQESSHLLGNGVLFNEDSTKEALGGADLDNIIHDLGEYALIGGVSFGFVNKRDDHYEISPFKVTEFVPLWGEEDGRLHAGIRFWQLDSAKPLRVTLYEEDGYTDYIRYTRERSGEQRNTFDLEVLYEKRPYILKVAVSEVDGEEVIGYENYPSFPVVPMWGNKKHISEIIGLQYNIDAYDLIKSGFANDLDDVSQIYWIIQNAGGMDDLDLVKFVERMKTVRAAVVQDDGARAEAHTTEIPYVARETFLDRIEKDLYRDSMSLNIDKIVDGTIHEQLAIEAAYENLTLKCDKFEFCVTEFLKNVLALVGIDDEPSYTRSKLINMAETTQMVLSAAQFLDDETILRHLPWISPDEIEGIMDRRIKEEADRVEVYDEEADEIVEMEPVEEEVI